ncbi:hypothetical protein D9M69_718190 [compost metagenome]
MLLAGLQGHPERPVARSVYRHADDPAGDLPFVFVFCGKKSSVRPAEAHRNAQPLTGAHGYVGAHLSRAFDQRERKQIRIDADFDIQFV